MSERVPPAVLGSGSGSALPFDVIACDPEFALTRAAFCARVRVSPWSVPQNTLVVARTSKKEPEANNAACVGSRHDPTDVNHGGFVTCWEARNAPSPTAGGDARADGHMTVGGVTAFGLPEGLPLYVDSRVMDLDWIILGTGGRNGMIRIAPEVFRGCPRRRSWKGSRCPSGAEQGRRSRRGPGIVIVVGRDRRSSTSTSVGVRSDAGSGSRHGSPARRAPRSGRTGRGSADDRRKADRRRAASARAELLARGFMIARRDPRAGARDWGDAQLSDVELGYSCIADLGPRLADRSLSPSSSAGRCSGAASASSPG
jgi:hypothetical protein